jgi:hypothetical protein
MNGNLVESILIMLFIIKKYYIYYSEDERTKRKLQWSRDFIRNSEVHIVF